ncbi:hypothetical protein COCSUDRAFT_62800 [Coccomyxa subellipsoidea C-169]|uniref:Uncharacterized protein n=1 Tax=Coccomyxa subellipsoidea (strain C-169) TaxID=574566 RepID=I0Z0X9_COCSC|nr:hypothetical protein COCSUDRAFT_62800 [Coccomyxa subellipsoidea C-169]EIE24298.1 hypothetical protein COCSUDRAFT_62800 [Coccomyxa subellipsoidea C-169]|eukprot:XP_005648842.1 hypothetical protein COCSUDRAFT_62800 [Coccomyxa subellipsoidea C-169]
MGCIDLKQSNGTICPNLGQAFTREILVREVQRFHGESILSGKAFGELTHPCYTSKSFCSLNAPAVSHQIMAVWWRGNQLHGLIRLLDTASGQRAAQQLAAGRQLGASLRSWTSLVPDARSGAHVIQDDMHLITVAFVPRVEVSHEAPPKPGSHGKLH